MRAKTRLTVILIFFIFLILIQSVVATNKVVVDFYYSGSCGSCKPKIEIVDDVIDYYVENYTEKLIINKKEVGSNSTNRDEMRSHNMDFPSVRIYNNTHETKLPEYNITFEELIEKIDDYLEGTIVKDTYDPNIIEIPLFGKINTSRLSLPVLTILLGVLDSFNPCAFFILIFLLNLLLYMQSRKRMFLVGSIFIFFSGFFYFLFMFVLFSTFILTAEHIGIISLFAGAVAVIIGIFSIKDFFFFKKGPSLSIPDSKRPEIFKKMRNLIKTSYLPAIIGGAIFLAVTVNFYELLCTLGFPLIFTNRLAHLEIPLFQQYAYIFFYNVVYVIPLIIILFIFLYTLGRMKLTQWQGRNLKLVSGIMIFSFGLLFIIDYQILENFVTPILLLISSILATLIISYIWEIYVEKSQKQSEDEKKIED